MSGRVWNKPRKWSMHLKKVEKTDCLSKDCCTTRTNSSSLHNKLASDNSRKERPFQQQKRKTFFSTPSNCSKGLGTPERFKSLKTDPTSLLFWFCLVIYKNTNFTLMLTKLPFPFFFTHLILQSKIACFNTNLYLIFLLTLLSNLS